MHSPLVPNTEMLFKNPADNGELQKKKDIPQRQPRGTCHVLCFAPTPRLVLSEPLCETQPETTFRCHTIGHAKQPNTRRTSTFVFLRCLRRLEKKKPQKKPPSLFCLCFPGSLVFETWVGCGDDVSQTRLRPPPRTRFLTQPPPAPPSPSTCRRRSSTLSHTPRTKTRHPAQTRRANITWESCSIPCFPLPSQHPVPFLVSPCPHNPHGV